MKYLKIILAVSTPFAKLTVDTDNCKHSYIAKELKRCASKYPHDLAEITALGIRTGQVPSCH